MAIQTIDRGTSGDTGDKFKPGVAFDTCQANDDYLELNKVGTVSTFAALASTAATVGQVVDVVSHTSGGIGGGAFEAYSATHAATDNGWYINSATTGIRFRRRNRDFATIEQFGGGLEGGTNDCDPFRYAIAASTEIELQKKTYLIEPTASSGDFMLYLGTQNGNSSRNGMHIYGSGWESIIKLGAAVGRAKLLFGSSLADSLANMHFENFTIDLNGSNNLQTSYADPLRYNNAFYLYSDVTNIHFDRLYIKNGSGSQFIRCGDDTGGGYGNNVKVTNCKFGGFGIGLSSNLQQDVSVLYIQANNIVVDRNIFENGDFTFDLARGHTACELHGDASTIVTNNQFSYTQLPVLIASSLKDNRNVIVKGNTFFQTNYLVSLDGAEYDQRDIEISGNNYYSTKCASVICKIGNSSETAKDRENVKICNNTVLGYGNANQDTHFTVITDNYLSSLEMYGNTVGGFYGSFLYCSGTIRNTNTLKIDIGTNYLDSLGSTSGSYPNDPTFIHIESSSGVIKSLTIAPQVLHNFEAKTYTALGAYKVSGAITNVVIDNATGSLSDDIVLVVDAASSYTKKNIASTALKPIRQMSKITTLPAASSVNLFDFTSYGNNDFAYLDVKVYINTGGTANGTVLHYSVGYGSSAGAKFTTKLAGGGSFNADVTVNYSGTVLRVTSVYGSDLSMYVNVDGYSNKPIVILI